MSGSDSDDTYCSEISTKYHIMGRPKNKTIQKKNTTIVRKSTRILKPNFFFTFKDKIQKKIVRKRGKKILKPKTIKYVCKLKDTLSDMNNVVYKHISKKQIITKGQAVILLNSLNKMKSKQQSEFDDETYQVWEKLVRQFKSIKCSEETCYRSYDSQTSPCSTTPQIRKNIHRSVSATQNSDGSTSCDEIISSSIDEISENIIGTTNKKKTNTQRNVKKIKSMIPKEHLIKHFTDSGVLKTTHQSTDGIILPDNIVSNKRMESNKQEDIAQSIIIIDKSIPSDTEKYQIENNTYLESQSILFSYKEHLTTEIISNKTLSKKDLKVGDKFFSESNNIKNDAKLTHKTVLTNFEISDSKIVNNTNNKSVEKSTEIRAIMASEEDIGIVHDSYSDSARIQIGNDMARVIQSEQINIYQNAVADQGYSQENEISNRQNNCVISPSNDLNNKNIHIKNTSRNKKILSESFFNKSKSVKKVSNCIERDKTQYPNNSLIENSQNKFLLSENEHDTPQIKISSITTEVNVQSKNSLPPSHLLSDSVRNKSEILFNTRINEEITQTVVYKNTDMEIADMETESIFNSMNDTYFNNALSYPVENSQMTTEELFNNCPTKNDTSYDDPHRDRVHNNTSRSIPLLETNDNNNYHWLKNIDKIRKLEENELILKDTLPSFYLQTELKNVPLELVNEFEW